MQTLWISRCGIFVWAWIQQWRQGYIFSVLYTRATCTLTPARLFANDDKLLPLRRLGFNLQIHPVHFLTASDVGTTPELKCGTWMTVDYVAGKLVRHSNHNVGVTVGEGPLRKVASASASWSQQQLMTRTVVSKVWPGCKMQQKDKASFLNCIIDGLPTWSNNNTSKTP